MIQFELKNLGAFQKTIGNLKEAVQNKDTFLKRVSVWYMGQVGQTFRNEGARAGHEKWKELSPVTIAARRKGHSGYFGRSFAAVKGKSSGTPMILQDRGILRETIFSKIGDYYVEWGSNLPYAPIHQYGGMAGWHRSVRIPKREFLFLTPSDLTMFSKIYTDYLEGKAKQ